MTPEQSPVGMETCGDSHIPDAWHRVAAWGATPGPDAIGAAPVAGTMSARTCWWCLGMSQSSAPWGPGGAGRSVGDGGDANQDPAKPKQTEQRSGHRCFSPFMAEFGHCPGLLVPTAPGRGGGTAGWVTPDEPARRQTQLDATGVSRGCGGPWGPPGVPGRLRGPRSTGASPAAPGPRSPGSRWQATPCCFGCSSASASALCGRSLQNKRCRGLGGGSVCHPRATPGKKGQLRARGPRRPPAGPRLGTSVALLALYAAEGTS